MVSSRRAEEEFGFAPAWSIDDGIAEVKAVLINGRIRDVSAARFSNHDALRPLVTSEVTPFGKIHSVRGRVGGR